MPRRPRIEFEGAIYHVMAGNARQRIVRDDHDRERLVDDLRRTVLRCGWELLAFVFMENHLHLLLKTPRPNLARGMQQFLSSYAIWHGRRHRRVGHLFQGRYRAELIEDESYYWTVSRYIHLNPVRARLVEAGRMAVVELSRLCQAVPPPALGGPRGPAVGLAWRARWNRFSACLPAVRGGRSEESSSSPFREAFGGWVLGSERFVARLRELAGRSCLIHRFRVLVNWPQEIRRPSSRRFVITSAWSVRLSRVAAIRTSLERPPPGSAASTARSRCMNWLPCSASVGPTVSPT